MPGGKKRSNVGYESYGVTVPDGLYAEMLKLIETRQKWFDRVEFTREAIREKVAREQAIRPGVDAATAAQVRDRRA